MNFNLANCLIGLSCIIGGYLFGSIPNGVLIGRIFFHKDPRDYYSHNSGGSNVGRVFGKKIGVLVIFLDAVKTMTPLFSAYAALTFIPGAAEYLDYGGYDATALWYWTAGVSALLGHCFPVYLGFKGGKAVSSFVGLFIAFAYIPVAVFASVFFITLFKKKIVSISSILASACAAISLFVLVLGLYLGGVLIEVGPYLTWAFGAPYLSFGFEAAAACLISAAILILRHLPNIKRLREGTENTVKWIK